MTTVSHISRRAPLAAAALAFALSACAGMNDTQQRAVSGTAAGAAGGAVVGAIAGDTLLGAAIGAGAGLAGGLIVDRVEKDRQSSYDRGYEDGRRRR